MGDINEKKKYYKTLKSFHRLLLSPFMVHFISVSGLFLLWEIQSALKIIW